ncbi:hypothetical protein An05g01550 [Aspergillus niger]|uniref:Uncharacterized protein n=2 Tax=Aspergillus niger TaxID=5061 RepID=A2QKV6_ASPNC|nr:hypothetical protein An05g01550 [Aspergillus niger]CAK96493.1 hypothetical protein An05g01550 [Aspergillus niger]
MPLASPDTLLTRGHTKCPGEVRPLCAANHHHTSISVRPSCTLGNLAVNQEQLENLLLFGPFSLYYGSGDSVHTQHHFPAGWLNGGSSGVGKAGAGQIMNWLKSSIAIDAGSTKICVMVAGNALPQWN